MSCQEVPKAPVPELEHSTATRQAALTESLRAGTSPEPPREHSTLVERPERFWPTWGDRYERPQIVADRVSLRRQLDDLTERRAGLLRLLAALDDLPAAPADRAGA